MIADGPDPLHTQRGQAVHALVDKPGVEERKGPHIERALPLWNDGLGLIVKADEVEFEPDGTPYPVEYKRGPRQKAADIAVVMTSSSPPRRCGPRR